MSANALAYDGWIRSAFVQMNTELEQLYFPTVHLHDGRFHKRESFDHALYYQHPRVGQPGGTHNGDMVAELMPSRDYASLVSLQRPLLRRTLRGKLANQDTWIRVGRPPTVPEA